MLVDSLACPAVSIRDQAFAPAIGPEFVSDCDERALIGRMPQRQMIEATGSITTIKSTAALNGPCRSKNTPSRRQRISALVGMHAVKSARRASAKLPLTGRSPNMNDAGGRRSSPHDESVISISHGAKIANRASKSGARLSLGDILSAPSFNDLRLTRQGLQWVKSGLRACQSAPSPASKP